MDGPPPISSEGKPDDAMILDATVNSNAVGNSDVVISNAVTNPDATAVNNPNSDAIAVSTPNSDAIAVGTPDSDAIAVSTPDADGYVDIGV